MKNMIMRRGFYSLICFLWVFCFPQAPLEVEYYKHDYSNAKVDCHKIAPELAAKISTLRFNGQNVSIPEDISRFNNLETLSFRDSDMGDFLPQSIFLLPHLKELIIIDTRIHRMPIDIKKCTNLTDLVIGRSCIDTVPREVFEMPSLTSLYLYGNMITYIDTSFNPQLSGIEELHLDCNALKHIPEKLLRLPRLRKLILSHNQIDSVDPSRGAIYMYRKILGEAWLDKNYPNWRVEFKEK